jgi:hypothetical protein
MHWNKSQSQRAESSELTIPKKKKKEERNRHKIFTGETLYVRNHMCARAKGAKKGWK